MSVQGAINKAINTAAAVSSVSKIASKAKTSNTKSTNTSPASKDIEMAKKARKAAQDKINAIYLNKELSNRARTRRMGKILDEYKGGK